MAALVNDRDPQPGCWTSATRPRSDATAFGRAGSVQEPWLAKDRARKREELLEATEQELNKAVESVEAGQLKGGDGDR